jgi:glycogen operon protein
MARCFGVILDGRAQPTGIRRRGTDVTLLLIVNSYHDVVMFKLPEWVGGKGWECLIDTNQPDLEEAPFSFDHEYGVTGRSLLLFELVPEGAKPQR